MSIKTTVFTSTQRLFQTTFITTCLFASAGNAIAENMSVPLGQDREAWSGKIPNRGITKNQVQEKFGAPMDKQGPTGQPPIYYWEYSDFTVYFESEHVIHTVIKNRNS